MNARRRAGLVGLAALTTIGVLTYLYLKSKKDKYAALDVPLIEETGEKVAITEDPISPASTASGEESPAVRPHSVIILFGTQSGTSEHVAMDIRQHLQTVHGFSDVVVADIEYYRHYPPNPGSFFVFVIATYGDGEPSESAEQFWREMKSKALNESGIWQGIPVCVVGLGNKTYRNFCGFAVKLSKKLKTIRAHKICPPLKINDQDDTDAQLEAWLKTSFDPAVKELCARPPSFLAPTAPPRQSVCVDDAHYILLPPAAAAGTAAGTISRQVHPCSSVVKPIFNSSQGNFRIVSCRSRGTPSLSERKMYYVRVEGDVTGLYAGSTFGFFPAQAPADALFLLGLFEHGGVPLVALQQHRIEFKTEVGSVPNGTTIEELVSCLSNFSATPSARWIRSFLLPHLPENHPARSLFREGPEGDTRYQTLVKAPPLTLRELLSYIHGLEPFRLPLSFLLEDVSRAAPRQYTVASAIEDGGFTLLVAETFTHRAHRPRLTGLCSAMLNRLASPPSQLPARIRGLACTAIFQKDSWQRPGIWVVNGSGVSAAMAFLDQRRIAWQTQPPAQRPQTILFYGVRTSDEKDFAGFDLIQQAIVNGWLSAAYFAFSRNPSGQQAGSLASDGSLHFFKYPPQEHFYIHALVAARRDEVRSAVLGHPDSNIAICGSQAMKGTVWGALVGVFEEEGIEFLSNLIAEQRVLAECW